MESKNVNEKGLSLDIEWDKLKNYLKLCMRGLPLPYASQDASRLTLAYFVISSYDLLSLIDTLQKSEIIDWIYSLQILPDPNFPEKNKHLIGWRGSPFLGYPFNPSCSPQTAIPHDQGHIAMTYVALALLLMLGDDFSRVNKPAVLEALKYLQQSSGTISAVYGGCESDMRYIYCACCICYMLNDWSTMDKDKITKYIIESQSYDYAISQGPLEESHGGSTFCGLAALSLMGRLESLPHKDKLLKWLINRQELGFNGRPNKLTDTCYSFWVGASIGLLGHFDLITEKLTRSFTLSCQRSIGGFAKWPDAGQPPDVLHTYFSLCGLSFISEKGIEKVHPALGFSQRAHDRLLQIYSNFTPMKIHELL